jgi:NTE family protein
MEGEPGDSAYYFHTHPRPNNSRDTLLILCFSGGGTRAAALTYGVLEALRDIPHPREPNQRRLIEEVDAISSVSGGSITAAAYALHGDQFFQRFESDFLLRNVQTDLLWRTLNPFRWGKLWSRTYGRSDLAAELYDELLFDGATFGDLIGKPTTYAVINATDISSGARFGFTQYQFDLLSADLAPIRLSQAVAASSAVPGLFSPITLNNYAGLRDNPLSQAVRQAIDPTNTPITSRARYHFLEMASYLNSTNHAFIHLVDGGVSDNLGIRAVLDGIYAVGRQTESPSQLSGLELERVAIVVVNAFSKPDTGWARHERPPHSIAAAIAGATIPMDRYSYETIELLKEEIERWKTRQHAASGRSASNAREIRFYPVIVSFADLPDPEERRELLNLPTSFTLAPEDIRKLRHAGSHLLRQSPGFLSFLDDFQGHTPPPTPLP